jgi:Zn-dependent M28 family amino/carboxypeptidase
MASQARDLDLCFIAFDAEEEGLFGSAHYVEIMRPSERDALKAFINLDTVGVGSEWLAIGTPSLARTMQASGQAIGVDIDVGDLPPNASSDHASFLQGGLPAVFLYRADDPLIHTPQDVLERVPRETLEEAARLVIGFIQRSMA